MSSSRNGLTSRAKLDGIELEYLVGGSGEPVVLIHGAVLANYLSVLQREPLLTKNYCLVGYSRRGFGGSTHPKGSLTVQEQASDTRKLMGYLGVEKAHIVGHSAGGKIALQFALEYPEMVHTLSLLEPDLTSCVSAPTIQQAIQFIAPLGEMYQRGDKAGAINAFLSLVAGPDGPNIMEKVIPGAMNQAIKDADALFQIDLVAGQSITTAEDAKRVKQPVLSVVGADTLPIFKEIAEIVSAWFPQSSKVVIPNANHAFPFTNPRELAEVLSGFFARYPIQVIA